MSDIIDSLLQNLIQILITIITGLVGYFSIKIKTICQNYTNEKIKKDIVEKTVHYIEQIGSSFSCEEKKEKAREKALEWLNEKKISISETELEILIEGTVNCM